MVLAFKVEAHHSVSFYISRSPPKLTWVLLGSDRTWVSLELLRSNWNCKEGFVGVDWIRLVVLSHFVSFHISHSPTKLTWALLGSDRTWVLLELLE
nr:hypothetical protein CFP56_13904 [Quercus suber]